MSAEGVREEGVAGSSTVPSAVTEVARRPATQALPLDQQLAAGPELTTLASIEQRLLWLAVRIIDYANRERSSPDSLKVGGHQASCASVATLMTALYFHVLRAGDLVSVKPHAAPMLHAIEYLLGRLPRSYLATLRDFRGLQAYPSRTKDPFRVDYSTGSVGLGAVAPLFGAFASRYVDHHFGRDLSGRRFISLMGDAELDEGNIWEAVFDPQTRHLENVLWIVDVNRQSLDRVVPTTKARQIRLQFESAGWHVIELKYGRALRQTFARPDGHLLRDALDTMPNDVYQALFGADDETVGEALLASVPEREQVRLARLLDLIDQPLGALVRGLGGHDLGDVVEALELASVSDAPSVILAFTVKGYRLPFAGHPLNHSAFLNESQIDALRSEIGLTIENEWDRFAPESPEGSLCHAAAARLKRPPYNPLEAIAIPDDLGTPARALTSTQESFGRTLLDLSRLRAVGERVVTVSPDVSVSTNLGGWINKVGVFGLSEPKHDAGQALPDSPVHWRVEPSGRHIELGISEMNLFLLLGQLGMMREHRGEQLFPIGTLYDPFVLRGLESLLYSLYNHSRFVVAGTPSGISLSREGGAHQSTITPGVGIELPGLVYVEPCYAQECAWHLLEGLRQLQQPDGESLYLRLSTKVVDQRPFAELIERRGQAAVRADVLAGGYRLREPSSFDYRVVLVTCGALVPEALEAASLLESEEGVGAAVVVASSPDLLYRGWRHARLGPLRELTAPREKSHLETLLAPEPCNDPIVTVLDGASHALSFVGACLGRPTVPLGVDRFGQTGSLADLYEEYGIAPDAIVLAALIALENT